MRSRGGEWLAHFIDVYSDLGHDLSYVNEFGDEITLMRWIHSAVVPSQLSRRLTERTPARGAQKKTDSCQSARQNSRLHVGYEADLTKYV